MQSKYSSPTPIYSTIYRAGRVPALFLCSQEYTFANKVWHSRKEPSEEDED